MIDNNFFTQLIQQVTGWVVSWLYNIDRTIRNLFHLRHTCYKSTYKISIKFSAFTTDNSFLYEISYTMYEIDIKNYHRRDNDRKSTYCNDCHSHSKICFCISNKIHTLNHIIVKKTIGFAWRRNGMNINCIIE